MKLEVQLEAMCNKRVHSTVTRSSRFHCLIGVINKPTTVELCGRNRRNVCNVLQ